MKKSDNIGVTGVESIRLNDMKIEDLPIRENAIAKHQLPLAEDTERQNKINNIIAGYPKQRVSYLESRIAEADVNIRRINEMKVQEQARISEYTAQISLCKYRDKEIAKIEENDPEREAKIKQLFKDFPPYVVEKMEQQIKQSTESIERADEVIAQEYKTIADLREVKALCEQRDIKLRHLNAKVVG